MQEYLDIIDFCNNRFHGRTGCQKCQYGNYCQNCAQSNPNDCYCCIKRIHSFGNHTIHYQCEQMTFNYLIKHINRYASEVVRGINLLNDHFDDINACSIGCGPAPELYAIKAYYRNRGLSEEHIRFKGFDIQQNNIWNPIWDKTHELFGDTVYFFNQDVFDYYLQNDERVNLVVLNYMISDMIKFNRRGHLQFLDRLKDFLGRQSEAIVILNDVFSIDVYNAFQQIYHTFPFSNRFIVEEIKCRYFADMNHGLVFGGKHHFNRLVFQSSPLESRFDPFRECKSIQLLIKIRQR